MFCNIIAGAVKLLKLLTSLPDPIMAMIHLLSSSKSAKVDCHRQLPTTDGNASFSFTRAVLVARDRGVADMGVAA